MRALKPFLAVALLGVFAAFFSQCGPAPKSCNAASDCPSGQSCVNNACQSSATDGGAIPCTPGQVCRPAAGDCDLAETCGADGLCPEDVFNSGLICRPPAGPCDLDERCSGDEAQCPIDVFAPNTTICRSVAGGCDVAETCPGNGSQCPADAIAASGAVCRPALGVCDVPETCNGTTTVCPADVMIDAGVVCRSADGGCDVEETCTGDNGFCPPDALKPQNFVCRGAVNNCDVDEVCSGASSSCPADQFAPAQTACATASCTSGVATAAGVCTGTAAVCNTGTPVSCNGYQCNGTTCRTTCASNTDCLSTHYCQTGGQCAPLKPNGTGCAGASSGFECQSGVCLGSYADGDNDGYGTGTISYFCGSTAPAGRSTNNTDCCDSDNRAHPNQATYFTTARTGCGGYDFNCINGDERQYTFANACNAVGSCGAGQLDCDGTTGWSATTVPPCGSAATYVTACNSQITCNPSTCPGCTTCNATTATRTQGCR